MIHGSMEVLTRNGKKMDLVSGLKELNLETFAFT